VHIIKGALDRVIELDPRNDLAWHVLGRWYKGLADLDPLRRAMAQAAFGALPAGTYEEAVTCFEKAIQLNPARSIHYIELGTVYALMGRKDEARRFIAKGLGMPDQEKENAAAKREGEQLLAKLR
jgi:tetratricopeptide (TPR) repeat protein